MISKIWDNPLITPELTQWALNKCRDIFLELVFSWEWSSEPRLLQEFLKNSKGELNVELRLIDSTLQFVVKNWDRSTIFYPQDSDLWEAVFQKLSYALNDDEVWALFLLWAKNSVNTLRNRVIDVIASWKITQPLDGADWWPLNMLMRRTKWESTSDAFAEAEKTLIRIQSATSAEVRKLLTRL